MIIGKLNFLFRNYTIFVIVVFAFYHSSVASSSIPSVSYTHQQEFRFQPGARQASAIAANDLLQVLSEGSGRLRVFIGYEFSSEVVLDFQRETNGDVEVYLSVRNPAITGETYYKDFPLEEYLTPSMVDVRLQIIRPDGSVYNELNMSNIQWRKEEERFKVHTFRINENRNNTELTARIISIDFHYGDDYTSRIALLSASLSSYYKAHENLEKGMNHLQGLDARDYERTILNEFILCEAEVVIGRLRAAPFWHGLPIQLHDPENIASRTQTLETLADSLRNEFNKVISHIDEHLYQLGKERLSRGDTLKAREIFDRVLVYNPLHIPSHVSLGSIELKKSSFGQAMARFGQLMGKVSVPSQWIKEAREFTADVYSHRIASASLAMQDGRFLDALNILNELEQFCRSLQQWSCPAALSDSISRAHYGMYRSYLSVARRAYQSANYSFAVTYIESAQQYSNENRRYITDDSQALALLQQVVQGYYQQAEDAIMRYDFATALRLLETVGNICAGQPGVHCRSDAAELVRRAEEGRISAERISIPVMIAEPAIQMPEISVAEAAARVRDLLSKGHLRAWAGETQTAREHLNDLMQYVLRYDLRTDSVINARIVSLSEMIIVKECENLQNDMTSMINVMRDYFRRGYYSEAAQIYQRAGEMGEGSRKCEWDLSDTLRNYSYIPLAASYQALLHEAQGAYFRAAQQGFDIFIRKYIRAGDFFSENNLHDLGMRHENLFEFTLNAANSSLAKAVIIHLSDTGEPDEAVVLLDLLRREGFAARELNQLQEYAASRAARHIHARNPDIRPEVWLRDKTGNDPWFRTYARSFRRSWPG